MHHKIGDARSYCTNRKRRLIDLFALTIVGCIIVELLTGYPLLPDEDESNQLAYTIEMFGMPKKKFVSTYKWEKYFITSSGVPRYCVETIDEDGNIKVTGGYSRRGKYCGLPQSKYLMSCLNNSTDPLMVDFVHRCLEINPDDRMTLPDALHHNWLRRRSRTNAATSAAPITTLPLCQPGALLKPRRIVSPRKLTISDNDLFLKLYSPNHFVYFVVGHMYVMISWQKLNHLATYVTVRAHRG